MDAPPSDWTKPSAGYVIPQRPKVCDAGVNVDGRCVLGGVVVPLPGEAKGWGLPAFGGAGRCAAFPLFAVYDVPYRNAPLVGRDYAALVRESRAAGGGAAR